MARKCLWLKLPSISAALPHWPITRMYPLSGERGSFASIHHYLREMTSLAGKSRLVKIVILDLLVESLVASVQGSVG